MPDLTARELIHLAALPPGEADAYFRRKGIRIAWDSTALSAEAHARAFTVARVMSVDLLNDLRLEVERAIRDGVSYSEFERNLIPTLQRHGWLPHDADGWPTAESAEIVGPGGEIRRVGPWRLRKIYDTNLTVATQAGRFREQTQPAVLAALPYWQYALGGAEHHTPACLRRQGEIHRADDAWWSTNYPPNHWGCTGYVRSLSADEVSSEVKRGATVRQGGPDIWREAGKGGERWGFNPGLVAHQPDLSRYPDDLRGLIQ